MDASAVEMALVAVIYYVATLLVVYTMFCFLIVILVRAASTWQRSHTSCLCDASPSSSLFELHMLDIHTSTSFGTHATPYWPTLKRCTLAVHLPSNMDNPSALLLSTPHASVHTRRCGPTASSSTLRATSPPLHRT